MILGTLVLAAALAPAIPQRNTSGLPLVPENACYDVERYDLDLRVDPQERSIAGSLAMRARLLAPTAALLLDLDGRLRVDAVDLRLDGAEVESSFEHAGGRLRVAFAEPPELSEEALARGEHRVELVVAYGGKPREAPNPPWDGGFTWAETEAGEPWIATSCQGEGADLWWPCKDHPSDEPDSMGIRVTVPEPLVCASNGRLVEVIQAGEGWRTYHWEVSTPINNYGVALNIAPYETITREYESVAGERFPVTYWVLPENLEAGKALFEEILEHMAWFEEVFGPYPFRADKYGVAETPHLGMEHQTIIAYGNRYRGNPWGKQQGFDYLHHHEFAHEWFANLVSARDWNDFWIHEGFGTYAQALYVEELNGPEQYRVEMAQSRRRLRNQGPVAPREPRTTTEMYFSPQNRVAPDSDIYFKGSWVLHTLRWLGGDERFFRALRRVCYPSPEDEARTDGSQCRLVDTEEVRAIFERWLEQDLGWFFELYLRQPELPRLREELKGGRLHLSWVTPGDLPFPMPVPVRVEGELVRVECPGGSGTLAVRGKDFQVDPDGWLLRAE